MLKNYIKTAWRNLIKNKIYTSLNIFGLALGVCGCILIWLVGSFELSFDKFHPDGDRIYRVVNGGGPDVRKEATTIPPMAEAMRENIPGIERIAAYFTYSESHEVKVPSAGRQTKKFQPAMPGEDSQNGIIIADSNWFRIFSYQWLAGNQNSALRDPFRVVITESAAKLYFGNVQPTLLLGRELIYEDSLHVFVSGVVKDWTAHSDLAYTDFISFSTIDASFLKNRRHMNDWSPHEGMGKWYWPTVFVKMANEGSTRKVETSMNRIAAQHIETKPGSPWIQKLQPLRDIHFNAEYEDGRRKANMPTLYGLLGIAVFILILAAVNFINLATAQSLQRAKEIGVRKVLGSSRQRLVIQFLVETCVIVVIAVLIAGMMIWPALRFFRDYIPVGVEFNPYAPVNLLFLVGISIIITILAGFYPARVLSGYRPAQTLKGSGSVKGGEKWWLRRSLIVFQFTISLVFIIVTLVVGNKIHFMLNTNYGFRTDAIITVQGQGNMLDTTVQEIKLLKQRFSNFPGVAEVIQETTPPIGWGRMNAGMEYRGKQNLELMPDMEYADERFIPFYGIQIVAGRNIRHSDSLTEFVINETFAKQLGFTKSADAVGKLLYMNKRNIPIVGVVSDYHIASLQEAIGPMAIGQYTIAECDLGVKLVSAGKDADNIKATLTAMEKIYKEIYPGIDLPYVFMDDSIRDLYQNEQKTASLIRMAMGLAIFISCMGLFGLSLFTAERRSGEIGIRKVLGATAVDITLMLNRQFIRLILLALIIASPIAWMLSQRWLQNFAYKIVVDVWIFLFAGLGAIGLAILTVSYQSLRAARTNPVKSLKIE